MTPPTGDRPIDTEVALALARAAARYRIDRATAEVCARLASVGIPSVVLKGPATARVLYQSEPRFYNDVDLLIDPRHRSAATEVLESLGFTRAVPERRLQRWIARQMEGKDREFFRLRDSVALELHRSFHLIRNSTNLYAVLLDHRDYIDVAGIKVCVPNRAAVGLLCLLHAKSIGVEGLPSDRIIEDLRRALDQLSDSEWAEAADIARRVGAQRYCVAVLEECGEASGQALATSLFPGIKPDRWLHAHLRSGGFWPIRVLNYRAGSWRWRATVFLDQLFRTR
jgi:Uncharacterised nucleotidyltransferase